MNIQPCPLSDATQIPPPIARQVQQYPCRTVFSMVSQTIAATTPLLSVKMAYRSPTTDLTRGASQKKACLWSLSRYRGMQAPPTAEERTKTRPEWVSGDWKHYQASESPVLEMGGTLFREYCFGTAKELTEFCGKLGEFCKQLGEFTLEHK